MAGDVLKPPDTIIVLITGEGACYDGVPYYRTEVDFKDYVKGVLPNEWYPTWDEESLKAGAVAAKMYGWSMYETYGYVWDCNWNQVYNPAKRTDATDKAVEDTWNWILLLDNKIVRTYYDSYLVTCHSRGAYDNCMGQWNSYADAKEGMNFEEILYKYYKDSVLVEINKVKPEMEYRRYDINKRLYYFYWFY